MGCALAASLILVGCTSPATQSPTPSPSVSTPATPSPTAEADFTEPGAAEEVLDELVKAADSTRAVMLEFTESTASLTVLKDDSPKTWAYRDGKIDEATSDVQNQDQAVFDPYSFNLSDLGTLFKVAAAISGSDQNQRLQLVDYSGGRVLMTVTTNPESKTVFFYPDGTALPILDFNTRFGVEQGIEDAADSLPAIYSLSIDQQQVAVEYPGTDDTVVRRQRTPRVPVTTLTVPGDAERTVFSPAQIDGAKIWDLVQQARAKFDLKRDCSWSLRAEMKTPEEASASPSPSPKSELVLSFDVDAHHFTYSNGVVKYE